MSGRPPREDRARDSGRERNRSRDRPSRDSGRSGPSDRGGRSGRSRSPRRERGGRRSDNRYRSRSPLGRDDRNRDSGRGGRGGDRSGRDDNRAREPPRGPRGEGGRNGDYRPNGGPVKAPAQVKDEPKESSRAGSLKPEVEEAKDVKMEDQSDRPEGMDEETWEIQKIMGFGGFKSTKETKVPGNDKNWGIRKEKELKARQYMNRQGGFNRPLSPSRDG